MTADPAVHRQFLDRCRQLDSGEAPPGRSGRRKARRKYENRVDTLAPIGP
ncbi:hypothetical protein ABZY93_09225 [Streptomyces smyrnaeus]